MADLVVPYHPTDSGGRHLGTMDRTARAQGRMRTADSVVPYHPTDSCGRHLGTRDQTARDRGLMHREDLEPAWGQQTSPAYMVTDR